MLELITEVPPDETENLTGNAERASAAGQASTNEPVGIDVGAKREPGSWYVDVDSPIGVLTVASDGDAITGLYMESHRHGPVDRSVWVEDTKGQVVVLRNAREQLNEYFAGERTEFVLPLGAVGTDTQRHVWRCLGEIPFGETRTYGDIARSIGNPKASRAVGAANGRNPISIIVPCHRVIGSNGALTGFGGGIERKQWLLAHEARVRAAAASSIAELR